MDIEITSGKIDSAKKVVIYGPEGIGKSTLASRFPDPLFIDTEGGTKELDVKRLPAPASWEYLTEELDYVINTRPCKTLVVDTVDWAETLCIKHICAKHNKSGIEDFGYGNGYVYEKEAFERFLAKLKEVVDAGINVVLTAHAVIKKFEQPDELGSYDRYEMKLGKRTTSLISPLVKEWADIVLFANYKTIAVAADKEGKKHKAQGGRRVMYTSHHPCWDAKNRYGLPDEINMDYAAIAHIFGENGAADTASKSAKPINPQPEEKKLPADYAGLPKALTDLMSAADVTEEEIRGAVADKGYFPITMPVRNYPKEFIDGVLIGAWEQVKEIIVTNRAYPFG